MGVITPLKIKQHTHLQLNPLKSANRISGEFFIVSKTAVEIKPQTRYNKINISQSLYPEVQYDYNTGHR